MSLLASWGSLSVDDLMRKVAALTPQDRNEILRFAGDITTNAKFIPHVGPQMTAFFSPADIMLYGGQAGGGKTGLILGLAVSEHRRSLIMRDQFNDLSGLTEAAIAMNGTKRGFNGSNPPSLRTEDGRFIQFSGATTDQWQGQAFDLKAIDEAAQVPENVIRFHIGWLRSTVEGQRKRAILASNPPVDERGQYLVGMFRPWLDPLHPNPAEDGELRWYAKDPDGVDIEVPSDEPVMFPGYDKPTIPMSRTFIRARLQDNPSLSGTGYDKMLDAMEEPYRSAMRDGNFMGARRDKEDQVIPLAWIRMAMSRWKPTPPRHAKMTAVGMDVSSGGADPVVLAPRYGSWFAKLEERRGKDCPDGAHQAAFVALVRRDNAPVVVDTTGGYGGDVTAILKSNKTPFFKFNGAGDGPGKATDGSGRGFLNMRAKAWWQFRDALNPDQPGGSSVELPPDPELEAELSAPTFVPEKRFIQIESKKDIRKRLGRSTNKADAVIMAWGPGETAAKREEHRGVGGGQPTHANVGHSEIKEGWRNEGR